MLYNILLGFMINGVKTVHAVLARYIHALLIWCHQLSAFMTHLSSEDQYLLTQSPYREREREMKSSESLF